MVWYDLYKGDGMGQEKNVFKKIKYFQKVSRDEGRGSLMENYIVIYSFIP